MTPSPAHPEPYITRLDVLSQEGITIDQGVDRARRDAIEFADKYSADFTIVLELRASIEAFSANWTRALWTTRDAASTIAAWYQRFIQVFLSLIDHITSESDVKDVITEFNSFLGEQQPSSRFDLNSTLGVKNTFNEIEALVTAESQRIIDVLQKATPLTWKTIVEELSKDIVSVRAGAEEIRLALLRYAVRLE